MVKEKEYCCGCSACSAICPKNCISMEEDTEGFYYPVVDDELIEGDDAKFEMVMLALRTTEGLSLAKYKNVFGTDFPVDFFEPLKKNVRYLSCDNGRVRIKDEYLYVQNQILMDFIQ